MSSSGSKTRVPGEGESIVSKVRERYADIVRGTESGCCGETAATSCCAEAGVARKVGYASEDLDAAPQGANLGLGCGAPVARLALEPGETVLDLGSGAGLDAFLAAREVGPTGKVIGVDMTPEMIDKATALARESGLDHVEFREGRLESLPLEDASVDAVTSNCVINLVPDKGKVFREIARVLRPGGRLVVSDIVLDGELPATIKQDLLAYVGCVAGAMRREHYFSMIEAAGLSVVDVMQDVDYVERLGGSKAVLESLGRTEPEADLGAIVRSVTYRAEKP